LWNFAVPVHDIEDGKNNIEGKDVIRIGEEADAGNKDNPSLVRRIIDGPVYVITAAGDLTGTSAGGMDLLELQAYFVVISTFNKVFHAGSRFIEPAAPINCR
jgi:hypothetical protein